MTDYTPRAQHWLITVAILLLLAVAGGAPAAANDNEKVGICHATNSASNPYVYIEVAEAAAKAHLDGSHPSHHGVTLEDEDYLADGPADCDATPTSTATEAPQETGAPAPTDTQTTTPATSAPSVSVAPAPAGLPDTAASFSESLTDILQSLAIIVLAVGFYLDSRTRR